MRFEKVCKVCYRSTDHKKNPTYTPAPKDSTISKCSVCHNDWEPQVICYTEGGIIPIRPRPNIPVSSPTYKLCENIVNEKKCRRGPECSFAHSEYELRYWFQERVAMEPRLKPPDQVKKFHLELCKSVLEEAYGYCKYGGNCSYPHSEKELKLWTDYRKQSCRSSLPFDSSHTSGIRPKPKLSSPPPKYALCKYYSKSKCTQGKKCPFAHSQKELAAWNDRDNADIQDQPRVPKGKYQENLLNRESESDDVLYEAESTNIPIKEAVVDISENVCIEQYKKAVRENALVTVGIVKAMTIGPPRVGKTCLRSLLLGKVPPRESPSTSVIKTAETLSMNTPIQKKSTIVSECISTSGWEVIDTTTGIISLLDYLQRQKCTESASDSECWDPPSRYSSVSLPDDEEVASMSDDQSLTESFQEEVQEQKEHLHTTSESEDESPGEKSFAEKLYKAIANSSEQPGVELFNANLLQFLDTGGQISYHDILPVFITTPAIYLHVFNLSDPLDSRPTDCIQPEGRGVLKSVTSPLTTLEMISRSAMTVHSLANKNVMLPCLIDEKYYPKPKMVIVGTHIDKLVEIHREELKLEDKLHQISRKLDAALSGLKFSVIKSKLSEKEIMFHPVDNYLYGKDYGNTDAKQWDTSNTDSKQWDNSTVDLKQRDTGNTDSKQHDTGSVDSKQRDTSNTDSKQRDTGSIDSKQRDTGSVDSKQRDTSNTDSKQHDTGSVDSKQRDTSNADSKQRDTGSVDSKQWDTGSVDSKQWDTGSVDSKQRDTGSVDSKQWDTGSVDSKQWDTSTVDLKQRDTSNVDSKQLDTGNTDSKQRNTGSVDSKQQDTGTIDSKQRDTGTIDSKQRDTGSVDSKQWNTGTIDSRQRDTIKTLRKHMEDLAKGMKFEIPVPWYLQQLILTKECEEKPFYKYGDLLKACKTNRVVKTDSEFYAMITLFHNLGLVVHHDVGDQPTDEATHNEQSTCFVFSNPSFLYENISRLYSVQFEECYGWKLSFKTQGLLQASVLTEIGVDEKLPQQWFMDLLVTLFIGAKVSRFEERTLFVPSVLLPTKSDSAKSNCPTLSLMFEVQSAYPSHRNDTYIPCGVFTGTIARLQSQGGWRVNHSGPISRTSIVFEVDSRHFIQLTDSTQYITIDVLSDVDTTTCQELRDTVFDCIQESYQYLFKEDAQFIIGLPCRRRDHQNHIAKLTTTARHNRFAVRCLNDSRVPFTIDSENELKKEELNIFLNIRHPAVKKEYHIPKDITLKKPILESLNESKSPTASSNPSLGSLPQQPLPKHNPGPIPAQNNEWECKKPTEIHLRRHICKKIASNWKEVCTYLGVPHEDVKSTERDNPHDNKQAIFECLMLWHKGNYTDMGLQPAWKVLLEALEEAEYNGLAKELRDKLSSGQL